MKFDDWKQKLLNPPEQLVRNSRDESSDTYEYIGDTKVVTYSGQEYLAAGLWLQTTGRQIRVYYRGADPKHSTQEVQFINFQGDNENGLVHRHNSIELGYVIQGCARQSFSGKEYLFNEGDFWIVDRNCFHNDIFYTAELFTVYIAIPPEIFDNAFLESINDSEIQYFIYTALLNQKKTRQFLKFTSRNSKSQAVELIWQIFEELVSLKIGFQNIVKGLISRLLATLSLEYDYFLTRQQKTRMNQLLYKEVESYIRDNYQIVTIHHLVNRFHYNEDFYNRLIREYSGFTYSEFLQQIRMNKAETLLLTTKSSVDDIASQVGYQSKGYFYKVFIKYYGMTPGQYRRQYYSKNKNLQN